MEQAKIIQQLTVFYDFLNGYYFHKDNTNIQEKYVVRPNILLLYGTSKKCIRQLTVLFFYDYLNSSYFHKDNTNIQENMLLGQNNVVYI